MADATGRRSARGPTPGHRVRKELSPGDSSLRGSTSPIDSGNQEKPCDQCRHDPSPVHQPPPQHGRRLFGKRSLTIWACTTGERQSPNPWVAGRLDSTTPAPWTLPDFRGFWRRGMACSYVLQPGGGNPAVKVSCETPGGEPGPRQPHR